MTDATERPILLTGASGNRGRSASEYSRQAPSPAELFQD